MLNFRRITSPQPGETVYAADGYTIIGYVKAGTSRRVFRAYRKIDGFNFPASVGGELRTLKAAIAQALSDQLLIKFASAATHRPDRVRAWWERHGLDKLAAITADDVFAAIEADHDEALLEYAVRLVRP